MRTWYSGSSLPLVWSENLQSGEGMIINPIRTTGIGLSKVRNLLNTVTHTTDKVTVETRRTGDGIDVFVFDAGAGISEHRKVFERICAALSSYTYGIGEETLRDKVSSVLIKSRKSLAVAESLTGGLIADVLTDVPGSSRYFMLSVVVYSDESKIKLLGVPERIINRWGAVSRQTCVKMLEGLSGLGDFHYRLAVTGIAGPGGGSSAKPVGTVYAGIMGEKMTEIRKLKLVGTRREIKEATTSAVLELLWREMNR